MKAAWLFGGLEFLDGKALELWGERQQRRE
jgi:hypothetical protein